MPWTLILDFIKGNWLKAAGYLVLAVFVGYWGYRGYDWVYERGASHQLSIDQKKIDTLTADNKELTTERDGAIKDRDHYIATYNQFVKETKSAREQAEKDHQAALAALTKNLDTAHRNITKLKGELKDAIAQYVTPKMDDEYTVPLGFVSLYNQSIQAPTTGSGTYLAVPGSPGFLADAPSGIKASYAAGIVVDNNTECVERGKVIAGWQKWYWEHKAIFDKALGKEGALAAPK